MKIAGFSGLEAPLKNLKIAWGFFVLTERNYANFTPAMVKNIFGEELIPCCLNPITGYFRDGYCRTEDIDYGRHVVCAIMTEEFLKFSLLAGNDLSTPRPEFYFPGLKPGDQWCLCALRWKEAYENNAAPQVILEACAEEALRYVDIDTLIEYAFKANKS